MIEFSVYTDGACDKQGYGGWAWLAVTPSTTGLNGTSVDGGSGCERETTNNRMELWAVIDALSKAPPNVRLNVVTDSAYVSNCFLERWYDGWRANGWVNSKKKPVENRDLWEELIALVEARAGLLRWTHVRGHGKRATDDPIHVYWNAAVDETAVRERTRMRNHDRWRTERGPENRGPGVDSAQPTPEGGNVAAKDEELVFTGEARIREDDLAKAPLGPLHQLNQLLALARERVGEKVREHGYEPKHDGLITVKFEVHAEARDDG